MYLRYAFLLVWTLLCTLVYADDAAKYQAETSIRHLIQDSRRFSRVYFIETNESFLSFSEKKITGSGVASKNDGWGGTPFDYSIKVKNGSLETRDAEVRFEDGQVLRSNSSWTRPRPIPGYRVRITSPRWYENLRDSRVEIRGDSNGVSRVQIRVYDRNGRQVASVSANPEGNGRWRTTARLPEGTLRAVATQDRWDEADEVRFTVNRSNGDWGDGWGGSGGSWDSDKVDIDYPQNGSIVNGDTVRYRGRSNERDVDVRIFEGDRQVHRAQIQVRNGRWEGQTRLDRGRYRFAYPPADAHPSAAAGRLLAN